MDVVVVLSARLGVDGFFPLALFLLSSVDHGWMGGSLTVVRSASWLMGASFRTSKVVMEMKIVGAVRVFVVLL